MRSCQLDISLEIVLLLFYTLSNKILHQAVLGFTSVCKFRMQSLFSNNAGQCIILPPQSYRQKSNSNTIFTLYKIAFVAGIRAEADPGFSLGGGALVPSTPINRIVFFLQNTSCIRKPQVISGGGGLRTPYTLPVDPPLTGYGFCSYIRSLILARFL